MASLVKQLQKDILDSSKGTTQLLRTAKLISAKLTLDDITTWINSELTGYKRGDTIPEYRYLKGGTLQLFNPYHGWLRAGDMKSLRFPMVQPVTEIEELATGERISFPPPRHIPVESFEGVSDGMVNSFQQRITMPSTQLRRILQAIKDELLNWSIELEQRGIIGENMSFEEKEKQFAHTQIFNIQHLTGVAGNVNESQIQIHDYSSVHQTLKQQQVPQEERNKLENLMDQIKAAPPEEKRGLLEQAKRWIVTNQDFLGASASIVRKALGLDS